jgi:beta-lactamase superfamily II metal-dependent hydrolase
MALSVHFLNVGHGDCTFIEHPSGRISMIDINNSMSLPEPDVDALADSLGLTASAFRFGGSPPDGFPSWEEYYRSFLVDPVDYFKATFGADAEIWRYIQTHPDMDHMGGLFRFFRQERIRLLHMWDVEHTKELDSDSFTSGPYNEADWLMYQLMRLGSVDEGRDHKVLNLFRGDHAQYWVDDNLQILGPTKDLVEYANDSQNWNNLSYVLRVEHAGRSIILPGDAEKPAWDKIESFETPDELGCDILKASHHGRESGYSESAVDAMSPEFVICSVGKKPSTDASDEYASHGATVLSTRFHGTITVTIYDDGSVSITDRKGKSVGSLPALEGLVA